MNGQDLVSVVLCCYNGAQTVGEQLAALAQQDYAGPWELVFVNDASTDASVAIAESWQDRVPLRTVHTDGAGAPVGLANARNVGGRAARGQVLLFCDADDVADAKWISALAYASRDAPAVGGFLEETLLNQDDLRTWRFPVTAGELPLAFGKIPAAVGANCGVWTKVFNAIGGFDTEFSRLGSGEDMDFFIRVQLAGYELRYVPTAVMHYRHRAGLRSLARQWYRYGRTNTLNYIRHRDALSLPRTTSSQTAVHFWNVVPHVVNLLRGSTRRGRWLRMSSFLAGQAVESARNRVWHLG
jgi:glycosyltransferase involved in cell wall biosynthesis